MQGPEEAAGLSTLPLILVASDTPAQIAALTQALSTIARVTASSTADYGELALEVNPALILLDFGAQDNARLERLRQFRDDVVTRDLPVICLVDAERVGTALRALDAGAADFLSKPAHVPELLLRVRAQLELKRVHGKQLFHSMTDRLTGLANRRRFEEFLGLIFGQSIRKREPLSLILANVDHFRLFNEYYGNLAGDQCLRRVAHAFAGVVQRNTDLLARHAGEEFVCVLADANYGGAVKVAERMREAVNALAIAYPRSPIGEHLSLSFGVASMAPRAGDRPEKLITAAADALERAKQSGRNRVES
jgi:diguanylate cyclase (GGDEF)-like protein